MSNQGLPPRRRKKSNKGQSKKASPPQGGGGNRGMLWIACGLCLGGLVTVVTVVLIGWKSVDEMELVTINRREGVAMLRLFAGVEDTGRVTTGHNTQSQVVVMDRTGEDWLALLSKESDGPLSLIQVSFLGRELPATVEPSDFVIRTKQGQDVSGSHFVSRQYNTGVELNIEAARVVGSFDGAPPGLKSDLRPEVAVLTANGNGELKVDRGDTALFKESGTRIGGESGLIGESIEWEFAPIDTQFLNQSVSVSGKISFRTTTLEHPQEGPIKFVSFDGGITESSTGTSLVYHAKKRMSGPLEHQVAVRWPESLKGCLLTSAPQSHDASYAVRDQLTILFPIPPSVEIETIRIAGTGS